MQAAAILLAAVLAGVAAIEGKSYQSASGIAITAIGVGTALVLGYVALGLAQCRRWSRTPALLTQLFTGIVGIYLVQGHRWSWGVPALVLCVAGLHLAAGATEYQSADHGEREGFLVGSWVVLNRTASQES